MKDDIRLMTFNELFKSRLEEYLFNKRNYRPSDIRFIESILTYYRNNNITKKQMNCLINVVDSYSTFFR